MKVSLRQTLTLMLALALILPGAMILSRPLEAGAAEPGKYADNLKAEPVKLPAGTNAKDFVANPAQPDIYTLRSDYKVERDGDYVVNYQPYVATVGADATDGEKAKVKKTIKLPDFPGYAKPQQDDGTPINDFLINYQTVVAESQTGTKTENTYEKSRDFNYKAKESHIKIKHVFQELNDFDKYGPKPGETKIIEKTQPGKVGSTLAVKPLPDSEIKGFIPEADSIPVQVPQNTETFFVEYRYNRNHFDVTFDSDGGTEVPSRTLYYGQVIPPIAESDIPTKIGATFVGWKPSVNLEGTVNGTKTTFPAGQLMKDGSGNAITDLDAKLIMPATNVKFTAVWEDRPKADYAIQFWTEKADHAKDASLLDKYEFVGTRVYKNQNTGHRPDLAAEPVKDVVFPDLDQARLDKIWRGEKFYYGRLPYLNKFYTYNKDLTNSENADPNAPGSVKPVSATGKTVYNIYFDRQVYDLYFTKSNSTNDTFYPEIWRHHKKIGWPGHPYHFKARFNQRLLDWPNDALETKGFSDGKQSFGWTPNYASPRFEYRDTPPYRLTAQEFVDVPGYNNLGGYTSEIDAGAGVTIKATPPTFTTLSFGIWESGSRDPSWQAVPHHMDFWMDGFEENPDWDGRDPKEKYEKIIDYDLYRNKADTGSPDYNHPAPIVQGFTPYEGRVKSIPLDADELAAMNDERADIKEFPTETVEDPYEGGEPHPKGEMQFMYTFFNRADEWGDPLEGTDPFKTNGYIRFYYKRNKYKLRFNNDPATIKADSDYAENEQTDIFYKKPLKDLNLNNVDTLSSMGLDGLLESDGNGKSRIKRPAGLAPNMVFKGWALDPAGLKMVSTSDETMPAHALVLYAKWGEPDFKWKVTFDPAGGTLADIDPSTLAKEQKTITEGDAGEGKDITYPVKGKNEGDKQVFTLVQRQKLVEPKKPTRKGYSFMGWEVLRYRKDAKGNYTQEVDTSYHDIYGVPELYSYGNDVVSPIYLKAIWVENDMVDVKVSHHFLDKDFAKDTKVNPNPAEDTLNGQRAGQYTAAIGSQQSDKWILATGEELEKSEDQGIKDIYQEYNQRTGFNNTYFQTFKVEPEKILENGNLVDNPKFKDNQFHFFYRPFRIRNYKVNYVDQRAKAELAKATTAAEKKEIINKYRILDQEAVTSGARHYDARNYKPITGWRLTSARQQQLFYDVDEDTNEFKGINGTGSDEITFYYQDVRIIKVPQNDPTPDGYVRVTFKASKGGSFGTDSEGKPIKEIHYVVLKGIKSDLLPVPQELGNGKKPDENKYYITPEGGKSFKNWAEEPLLARGTPITKDHTFTAQFDWADLIAKDVVTTESFDDPAGTWTNDFVPSFTELRAAIQLQSKDKTQITKLPEDATVEFVDENGNPVATRDDLYKLVSEKGKTDAEELVRKVNLKAKVKFADREKIEEIDLPIKVYKNRYDGLAAGAMPDFLKAATTGNGDLVKLLDGKPYVKVTVNPTSRLGNQTIKSYWVNPKAWVEIPEIEVTDKEKASSGFKHWSANKAAQNEGLAKLGVYDFNKRHKFSEDTVITPVFVDKVVTPVPEKKENKPVVSPGPVTGANALLYLYAAALFTAAGTALVISRTRRKAQRA
ncbi:InlB B-repeat-containing protein [Varibaculum cambriense]|uniref:InlB B-repeat-containing protein n=1 Tax=Varibaculum cambriense TaxID=184870 RepID=UPI000C7E3C53|nr:InlB B-repeat-containing protein [Varibaculum cambriense]